MAVPIMPQGTAIWLIENTSLTFEQIAQFCGLHVLEVQALADNQVSCGMIGVDPINLGQLTREEIKRCSQDKNASLLLATPKIPPLKQKSKKKYTPLSKRRDRPDAIAWLLKFYPDIADSRICSLLSTTKTTVIAIRDKTHAKMREIKPRDPVLLGFCTQVELDNAIVTIRKKDENPEQSQ
ncbi:MAG: DUF1013 domain-containing protein [Holosporaceae bacterium]|jgi:hypothetical protein|nr:DUF1013 domain-containing protein [Holosporaceae bacterium]